MFFRNLKVFRLADGFEPSAEALAEKLSRGQFQPCAAMEMKSSGWVPPLENGGLVHSVNRQLLLTLRTEQKLLPGSVVRRAAQAKAKEIEAKEGRKPGRREMKEIAEGVTAELLPRAFPSEKHAMVWIDPVNRWMVVDGTSARADEVIEKLKLCLEELPLRGLRTALSPSSAMTGWLASNEAPAGFSIDRDCELRSNVEEKATVKYARHSLDGDEVRQHVAGGKAATRLAMTWNDRVSFVLTESFEVKRLAFLDLIKEDALRQAECAEDLFDAEFVLMTGELARLQADLVTALGGEAEA